MSNANCQQSSKLKLWNISSQIMETQHVNVFCKCQIHPSNTDRQRKKVRETDRQRQGDRKRKRDKDRERERDWGVARQTDRQRWRDRMTESWHLTEKDS